MSSVLLTGNKSATEALFHLKWFKQDI